MIYVSYRKYGIRLGHVWFASESEIKENRSGFKSDLLFIHGIDYPLVDARLYTQQNTVIKDLSLSEDDLFLTLGKHLRQYIKRSAKENLIEIKIYSSQDILQDEAIVENCKNLYEKMFFDKGMKEKFNTDLALVYARANTLSIGMAYSGNRAVGFSAVIHDENDARLWLAAFDFRDEYADSQVLSRAHQRLDWELICFLKRKGITKFDFGGINSFDSPNGISEFKMKFENENRVTYNNYLLPMNLLGRLALKVFLKG